MSETVLHQWVDNGPRVSLKAEKNTRGFNYEISISGCSNVEEAMKLLREARKQLEKEFPND
jgi:hypothetical protein